MEALLVPVPNMYAAPLRKQGPIAPRVRLHYATARTSVALTESTCVKPVVLLTV